MAHRRAKRETRKTAAHGAPAQGRVAQEKGRSRGAHVKADGIRHRRWQPLSATQADTAHPLRRRQGLRARPPGQDGRRERRTRSGGATAPLQQKHPVVAAAAAARQGRLAPTPRALRPPTSPYAREKTCLAEPAPPSSERESDDGKTSPRWRHRARGRRRGQSKRRVARRRQHGRRFGRA